MDEQKIKAEAERLVEKIKALVREGNVSRVKLKRKGETLVNIPVNAGIVGALVGLSAAPFAVLTAALIAFGLDCQIEIEKKDGSVTDLTKTVGTTEQPSSEQPCCEEKKCCDAQPCCEEQKDCEDKPCCDDKPCCEEQTCCEEQKDCGGTDDGKTE